MLIPTSSDRQYKEHQVIGIEWMLNRERQTPSGGLLCDEMGLGKSEQILGLIANTTHPHTLLLCPKSLIPQWKRDFLRCGFAVFLAEKGYWKKVDSRISKARAVYLTNYEDLPRRGSPVPLQQGEALRPCPQHQGKVYLGNHCYPPRKLRERYPKPP
ncbi:MAG: hypothetical protein EBT03_08985 [Betaproteobacteria bacterium]|nr:hypothetical protein [Betaproteobacteria bacterium]